MNFRLEFTNNCISILAEYPLTLGILDMTWLLLVCVFINLSHRVVTVLCSYGRPRDGR